MGMTPLSTPIKMRGKSVFGNTATGIVNARYSPTSAIVMVKKITGRDNFRNHGSPSAALPFPWTAAGRSFPGWRSMSGYSLPFAGFLAGADAGFLSGELAGAALSFGAGGDVPAAVGRPG